MTKNNNKKINDINQLLEKDKEYNDQLGIIRDVSRNQPNLTWMNEIGNFKNISLNFTGVTERFRLGDIVTFSCRYLEQEYYSGWEAYNIKLAQSKLGYVRYCKNENNSKELVVFDKKTNVVYHLVDGFSDDIKLEFGDIVEYFPGYALFTPNKKYAYSIYINASGEVSSLCKVGDKITGVNIKWRPSLSRNNEKFDHVFYQFQHHLEPKYVIPGCKAIFVPFYTINKRQKPNLMVRFGSFTCIVQGTVLKAYNGNEPGTIRFDHKKDILINYTDEDLNSRYALQDNMKVIIKYYGDKVVNKFKITIIPHMTGTIRKNMGDTIIVADDHQIYSVDPYKVRGNIPLYDGDEVSFELDEDLNAIDIMIENYLEGVVLKQNYFTVRDIQVAYPLNETIHQNDYATFKLIWSEPELRATNVKVIPKPPPGFDEDSKQLNGWNDNYNESSINNKDIQISINNNINEDINNNIPQKSQSPIELNQNNLYGNNLENNLQSKSPSPPYGMERNRSPSLTNSQNLISTSYECPVAKLLNELYPSCPNYISELVDQLGLENIGDFNLMTEKDWELTSIKPIHKRKILREVENRLKTQFNETPNNYFPSMYNYGPLNSYENFFQGNYNSHNEDSRLAQYMSKSKNQ